MAIRDPWVTGTSSFDVEETRVANGAVLTPATNAVKTLTGIRPGPGNPGAVTATGTPDGFTHVAPFQAFIQSSRAANAGTYTFTSDTTFDVNHLGGTFGVPANATNPRNDLVIAHVPDTFYGDPNSTPLIRPVIGTPSGSPADPSLAAFPDAITLARVRVNANATTITSGNITDLRPVHTVALGGILPTATATTRNALTGLYDGSTVYRRDRNWLETYDGGSWRVDSIPVVSSSADLSAITNPSTGSVAYSTGDSLLYRYTGAEWRVRGTWAQTQTVASTTPSVTFTVPTYLRTVTITWSARCDAGSVTALGIRINADATGVYFGSLQSVVGGTFMPLIYSAATSGRCGVVAAATTGTGKHGYGTITVAGWNNTTGYLGYVYTTGMFDTPSASWAESGQGIYFAGSSHTTITLQPQSGSLLTGSRFTVTAHE